jgi:succinate dehydrogenase flavin-adding protein (antitoxin of CptAB toxin-antitoxin module)
MPKISTEDTIGREARFLSARRSTLELETLLTDYFEREWEHMDGEKRLEFVKILQTEDSDLERYLFKNHPPPFDLCRDLVERLRRHSLKRRSDL